MTRFHIGMREMEIRELPDDLQTLSDGWETIQEVLNFPVITEEQIMDREIPEGAMYAPFHGMLDGVPVYGRLVQTRENRELVIDVRLNTPRLQRLQQCLEQRIGRLYMTG